MKKKLMAIASPVDKIVLGRMFDETSEWLVNAFINASRLEEPPTFLEGCCLGIDDLVLIGQLRHLLRNIQHANGIRRFVKAALAEPNKVPHISGPRSIDTECKSVWLNPPSNCLI